MYITLLAVNIAHYTETKTNSSEKFKTFVFLSVPKSAFFPGNLQYGWIDFDGTSECSLCMQVTKINRLFF